MNPRLAQGLANLRRRLLAVGFGVGVGWGLAAAVALLLAWMWLDLVLDFPGTLRAAASWLSLLAGLALIALAVGAAWLHANPRDLARRLDAAAQTRGQILAGVDLAGQRQADPLSRGLADMAVERAGALAERVPASRAVPAARTLRWPFAGAGALLAAVGVLALAAPNLAGTQWARFTDPFGDHPPYSRVKLDVQPGDAPAWPFLPSRARRSGVVGLCLMIPEGSREMLEAIFAQPDNAGVLRYLGLRSPSDVGSFEVATDGSPFDEGGQTFFHSFGRSVPSTGRCRLELCNILVHERTARVFALHNERFTIALRPDPAHQHLCGPLRGVTLDDVVDLSELGPAWGLFRGDGEAEAAEAFLAAYEWAGAA